MLMEDAFHGGQWSLAVSRLVRQPPGTSYPFIQQQRLGICLAMVGRTEEANQQLDAELLSRIEPAGYLYAANLLLTHKQYAAAAARYRPAVRLLTPGEATTALAMNSLGNAVFRESPAEAARLWKIHMLGTLKAGSPNWSLSTYLDNACVIHRSQARDLIAQGKFREAADHSLAELTIMPGNVVAVEQVVPLLDEKQQSALADEVFERSYQSYAAICSKYPQSTAHRHLLARTAARCNRRLDEALKLAHESIAIDSARADVHATLAEVQLVRGDKPAAIAAAQAGLALEPKHEVCERVLAKAK
jgi:tetratricopeptide (TPR) repeat protein